MPQTATSILCWCTLWTTRGAILKGSGLTQWFRGDTVMALTLNRGCWYDFAGAEHFLLNIYRSLSLSPSFCLSLKHLHNICRHTHTHTFIPHLLDVIRHANRQLYHAGCHTLPPTHTWHRHTDRMASKSLHFQLNQAVDGWMEGGLDALSPLPLISLLIATN